MRAQLTVFDSMTGEDAHVTIDLQSNDAHGLQQAVNLSPYFRPDDSVPPYEVIMYHKYGETRALFRMTIDGPVPHEIGGTVMIPD